MDTQTIVLAIRGDAQAFAELLNHNKSQLYRIAFRYLKSEPDALEAIQETTFRAYRSISKLKEPDYFQTWLIRILINVCNNEHKRLKVQTPLDGDVNPKCSIVFNDSSAPGGRADLQRLDILLALDFLELKHRQVIELKYFEDLTIREIALILERPEGTIKTWLNQSYRQLKEHLRERGDSHG